MLSKNSLLQKDPDCIDESFKMGISIKHKIMLNVILVIFIALTASTYNAVITESKIFNTSLIQKGQSLTHNIAASTKSAFWTLNWLFVEDLLHDSARVGHEDIIYTKIVKPDGKVYLASNKKYYGENVEPELLKNQETIIKHYSFKDERVPTGMVLILPVTIEKENWHILLGLSTELIQKSSQDLIVKNIILGAILLLVSTTVFYLLSRSISKPIVDLARATTKIADGGRDLFIRPTTNDEIGLLGHSFNKMTLSIEKAEKALRSSNDRFIAVLDSLDSTIYVADINTYEILFMNRAMKEVFGSEYEDKLCYEFFRELPEPCAHCKNHQLLDVKASPAGKIVWEGLNPLNNRWYSYSDRAIQWIDNRLVHIQIAFDITETKELEQKRRDTELQLRQSQKMEAIGKLAGGVAHDLNNILSGIINYPELILLDLPKDHKLRKPIKSIQTAGERAAAIVGDLLTLARRGVSVNEVINLKQVIENYLLSPEHEKILSYHPLVKVEHSISDHQNLIKGSPVHLSKLLMNLVSNGAEAMPEGGKIQIELETVFLDEAINGYETIFPGTYVLLKISDEGIGIAREEQQKIFEPFYTKKVMGRSGTGLGMAVIWGTVKDHYGYIDLKSAPGKGTTFYIYLPITKEKLTEKAIRENELYGLNGNGETVLVVDDVKEQRELVYEMLGLLDYSVVTAASGEEAVEYVKNHQVDLLILDMIMDPGISGLETYRRILELQPGQRAIVVSGYSESSDVKKALVLGAGQYLRKPYNISILAKAVRQELTTDTMR